MAVVVVVVTTVVTAFESLGPTLSKNISLFFQFHKNRHTSLFDLG